MLATLASDTVLDTAYAWLCERRMNWPGDTDVWWLRFHWASEKSRLQVKLREGGYRFEPLSRVTKRGGEIIELWSARDALVLKALAIVLGNHLPVSRYCFHVKGHGDSKAAVRRVRDHLPANTFVLRTDVKSYYASIDHFLLLDQLARYIADRDVLNLLGQYLRRSSERAGLFWDYEKGISLGCPLSPLMGAFFLNALDERMEKLGLFYVRFMDDILVLAPTRWKLRKAVKVVNGILGILRLEKHPNKTFVGRIEKGFDFLGYQFSLAGLSIVTDTVKKFVERATRLYEREQPESEGTMLFGKYVRRWFSWARSGLGKKQNPHPEARIRCLATDLGLLSCHSLSESQPCEC